MNSFDRYLFKKAEEESESFDIPASVKTKIEYTINNLSENTVPENFSTVKKHKKITPIRKAVVSFACFVAVTVILLPNISPTYAQAMEKIPVIGDIIRVVTVRNYFYKDDRHEMDIDVPNIEENIGPSADMINKDINELTDILVAQFYKELDISSENGFGSINVSYEVTSNTLRWFTLKLSVNEVTASSNSYFKYYHIDKSSGKIVKLGDLFASSDYSDILTHEIKRQMKERMEKDDSLIYWVDGSSIGEDFASVDYNHNFYWNEDGNLVITFDKYEVAPGYMGWSEFTIDKKITDSILKDEFKSLTS